MNVRNLTLEVPQTFTELLKQRRLVSLSMSAILCFLFAWFTARQYAWSFALLGYFMIAQIVVILLWGNARLLYRFTTQGVDIISSGTLQAATLSRAIGYHMRWAADEIVSVEHKFQRNHSYVLLGTRNQFFYNIPVSPGDVNQVADFLLTHSSDILSDNEHHDTSIK